MRVSLRKIELLETHAPSINPGLYPNHQFLSTIHDTYLSRQEPVSNQGLSVPKPTSDQRNVRIPSHDGHKETTYIDVLTITKIPHFSATSPGEHCNNNTCVFSKGIWEKYDIGIVASGQALREPLFLQFLLNRKPDLFQNVRLLYVFSCPQFLGNIHLFCLSMFMLLPAFFKR